MTSERAAFFKNTKGAISIEYALLIALIALALIAALNLISTSNQSLFNSISGNIDAASPS